MTTTAAIVSGGMDSVTLAHHLDSTTGPTDDLVLVSFNYGQRHAKELQYATDTAARLDVEHQVVDLTNLRPLLSGSALTDDVAVPEGHYAEETMRQTIVPNRNAIMLTIAAGLVVARGGGYVATGVHAGDHFIYPDCRPGFVDALSRALFLGSDGIAEVSILAPFIGSTKAEIAAQGHRLGVPFELTWSCYQGGDIHCGVCGTCTERREAFEHAGVDDPTTYADLTRHW